MDLVPGSILHCRRFPFGELPAIMDKQSLGHDITVRVFDNILERGNQHDYALRELVKARDG